MAWERRQALVSVILPIRWVLWPFLDWAYCFIFCRALFAEASRLTLLPTRMPRIRISSVFSAQVNWGITLSSGGRLLVSRFCHEGYCFVQFKTAPDARQKVSMLALIRERSWCVLMPVVMSSMKAVCLKFS